MKTGSRFKLSEIIVVIILVVVLLFTNIPIGHIPALSNLLNPGTGIWATSGPQNPYINTSTTVRFNGSVADVNVYQNTDGFTRIASNQTWAVFYEQGYYEARYRLAQMDLLRRTGEGTLSQILGPSMIPSDEYFRTLETYQVAQQEIANLSKSSYTYMAIYQFTRGVNSFISSLTPDSMPLFFKMLGYKPASWTMTDTFVVEQLLVLRNSQSSSPLAFNSALQKIPENALMALAPVYPPSIQTPIVPKYLKPSIYNTTGDIENLTLYSPNPSIQSTVNSSVFNVSLSVGERSALSLYASAEQSYSYLSIKWLGGFSPFYPSFSMSNDWAANGAKTANGSAILANDPHLGTTLPSIWMGFQLVAPGLNVVGVTTPGAPGIIIGHNPYIAWGGTNNQVQQQYFYAEETSSQHPYEYYYNGSWTHFQVLNETIQVKGSSPVKFEALRAQNGVVMTTEGQTIVMDWEGLYPTYELTSVLRWDRGTNFTDFWSGLLLWKAGIYGWAYADSKGNIGIFAIGDYPIIKQGNPRGILPGTGGNYSWSGFIPINEQPWLFDPSTDYILSANQVPVSDGYPYYIGWTGGHYSTGYRADQINSLLAGGSGIDISYMESMQLNVHDYSSNIFLPYMLSALSSHTGTDNVSQVYSMLSKWNGDMSVNSSAATFYHFWLNNYLNDTFQPWLQHYNVSENELDPNGNVLSLDLANWTVNYPNIQWFSNPITGKSRNSTDVMMIAYNQTLAYLSDRFGVSIGNWSWGKVQERALPSLFGIKAWGISPFPSGGDGYTIDAADGFPVAAAGPSWRMVVDMGNPATGVGIYPGGTSENFLSPIYSNTVQDFETGEYYVLIPANLPSPFYYLYRGGNSL